MEFLLDLFYFIFWNMNIKRSGQCKSIEALRIG